MADGNDTVRRRSEGPSPWLGGFYLREHGGSLPRADYAAQIIEVAPGLDIEPLTDVAVKHADVKAGILVVERQFGYLEIHSRSTA